MKKILHFFREYWKDPKIRWILIGIWAPAVIAIIWVAAQVHSTKSVSDLAHFMQENQVRTMAAVMSNQATFDGEGRQFGPVKVDQFYLDTYRVGWPVIVSDMDMRTINEGWWICTELDKSDLYLCQTITK